MVPTTSSSSSVQSPQVFINFRGAEMRKCFVSYLARALKKDGVHVYIDESEIRGEDLSIFFQRIEESKIAVVIISSQYTESRWCLDELVKIMECVDLNTLVVIPIFYKVDTDHVKNLEGEFGKKFWKLVKDCKDGDISRWRDALKSLPTRLGLTLRKDSDEGEFLEQAVQEVIKALANVSSISTNNPALTPPFGIERRIKQLMEKFDYDGKRTHMIGVVGMAGIGKTTLMETFYKNWNDKFRHRAFLKNVREMFKIGSIDQSILAEQLLRGKNGRQKVADMSWDTLKTLLRSKTSLIVLDNVSHKNQIDVLLGKCDWIKEGSLIFITTRDSSVIEGKVHATYEVPRLNGRDSLQCFSYFASNGNLHTPVGNFMNLSKKFADFAKGNPFALKMLGRELYEKDENQWEENLRKLAQSPNKKIQDALQISYDDLGYHQKDVFLDIACFFRSWDEYYVRCLVESCDIEPVDDAGEVKDLTSKFLINISGARVEMHDLLYTFGKELASAEPSSCRLWNSKRVVGALKNNVGAESLRGIFLDMSELKKEVRLGKFTFTKMHNLRYLKLYSSRCHRECKTEPRLNFYEGLEFSLDEIRYLYWLKFPFDRLPEDFNPKNLTDLNLPYSEIEEVWEGVKDTPKLKWVDLSHSRFLSNLSGLLNAENLQRLNLEGCTSLQELPKNMEHMQSLVYLNMRGCTSLCVLPHINLISMRSLILSNCSSLKEFQVISDNIENLQLDGTAISHLPTNMVLLQKLIVLNLKDCKMLEAVPECLGKLKCLQELVLSGCSKLKSFPIPFGNMKHLQILLLDGTAISDFLKLNCSKMEDVPGLRCGMNDLSSLRRLCLSRNDKISNLPIHISRLYHLRLLDLKYCKNLTSIPLLPPNLEILDAHGCEKLRTVASPMAALKLMEQVHSNFIFTNCNNLEQAAKNSITSYAQWKSQLDAVRCYKEGNVSKALLITSFPGSEVPSWFNHSSTGSTLELDFPPHWCDNRLSTIVLCAVVAFSDTQEEMNRFSIECTYEFKNGTDTCKRFSCTLGEGWIEPRKIDSEHVFIGYTSCSHITNHVEGLSQSLEHHGCVPTKALIEFKVRDGAGEIVNCGLSLVYEEPKHIVIKENLTRTCSRSWS